MMKVRTSDIRRRQERRIRWKFGLSEPQARLVVAIHYSENESWS